MTNVHPQFATPIRVPQYPLLQRFGVIGVLAGLSVAWLSPLAALALVILFVAMAAVWRRDEPPAFVWSVGYHWLIISMCYVFSQFTGVWPGFYELGDIEGAVFFSLISLVTLVAGYRVSLDAFAPRRGAMARSGVADVRYDPRRVLWMTCLLYAAWLIAPGAGTLGVATQPVLHVLAFRDVLLVVLFLLVIRHRSGYAYAAIALLLAIVPRFMSEMAKFKEVLFFLFIALATTWRPWARSDARRTSQIAFALAVFVPLLFFAGIVWETGIKPVWRPLVTTGAISDSPWGGLGVFFAIARKAVWAVDPARGAERLIGHFSSSTAYLSFVVDRVPAVVPHQDGMLTGRALNHILMPRVLFPEKPSLPSDSWMIRQFAGLAAAGDEAATSVGLGYMGEFYIDFGWPLMLVPVFLLGMVVGSATMLLARVAPSPLLSSSAATVLFVLHLSNIGNITKLLGGFVQAVLVFALILKVAGPMLHRFLLVPERKAPDRTIPMPGQTRR